MMVQRSTYLLSYVASSVSIAFMPLYLNCNFLTDEVVYSIEENLTSHPADNENAAPAYRNPAWLTPIQ